MRAVGSYLWCVLVAADRLLNTILFGCMDETICQRAGMNWVRGGRWGCWLCRVVDFIDRDHCEKALHWLRVKAPDKNRHWSDLMINRPGKPGGSPPGRI